MGFCSVKCGRCDGTGNISVPFPASLNRGMKIEQCPQCWGEGSHIVHTGSIGSVQISVDLAIPADEAWAVVWRRHDSGLLEVLDMVQIKNIKPVEPSEKAFTPMEGNPLPHLYRCTSGLGENCTCYVCHGG